MRDPFERTISAFLYSHPENKIAEIPYQEWKIQNPEKFNEMLENQNESNIFRQFTQNYKKYAHRYPRKYRTVFGHDGANLIAYNCFPTLDKFATLLTVKPNRTHARITNRTSLENIVHKRQCNDLANMIMQRELVWPDVMNHLYYDLNSITWNIGVGLIKHQHLLFSSNETKLKELHSLMNDHTLDNVILDITNAISVNLPSTENVPSTIMTIRTEFLEKDWIGANLFLGQNEIDIQVPREKRRDSTKVFRPVTKTLSSKGKKKLCLSLEKEYSIFFSLLFSSVNLSNEDLKHSIVIAKRNCGQWLDFDLGPKSLNEIHGHDWFKFCEIWKCPIYLEKKR